MFASVEPWGAGWAVRDLRDGLLIRRGFASRDEADRWSSVTDRSELREYFYPASVHWGEDYDERRGMKRILARSAEDALEWATTRQGAALTLDNIFPKGTTCSNVEARADQISSRDVNNPVTEKEI